MLFIFVDNFAKDIMTVIFRKYKIIFNLYTSITHVFVYKLLIYY